MTTPLARHLAHAVELHRRWCRDQGMRPPPELMTLVRVLTSSQEHSSSPDVLDMADDAGMPLAYDYAQAGRLLGVSASTITRMVEDGRLRSIPIGRSRRVPLSELQSFIDRQLDIETRSGDL